MFPFTNNGFEEFIEAVKRGDIKEVERRCRGEYKDMKYFYANSALHVACLNGHRDIVSYLLNMGWDIEQTAMYNKRPLHMAAQNGHRDIVKILVERRCVLDALTIDGETPYQLAIENHKDGCAEMLSNAVKMIAAPMQVHKQAINENKDGIPSLSSFTKGVKLGEGGFGKVYKCVDRRTLLTFAMKEMQISQNDPISKMNEININNLIQNHSNIVRYFGTRIESDKIIIFMEYMELGSVKNGIDESGPLGPTITARYCKQILEGLTFLHKKKIIHRDIKCANILRGVKETVKLCDFGLSKYLEPISNSNGMKSVLANTQCGTFFWMAPEVLTQQPYSYAADVWSFGITVVEMLAGRPPNYHLGPVGALMKLVADRGVSIDIITQTIPRELKMFLDCMLVFDQRDRASVDTLRRSNFILGA